MAANEEPDEGDEIFAEWMRHNLQQAAEHFDVVVVGDPVFGWRQRSAGAAVRSAEGPRWLRVVTEDAEWAEGDWWTGNADANAIGEVRKPRVLGLVQWDVTEGRRQRAELMTYVPGQRCSDTDALHTELDLPDQWWADLRRTVEVVRAVPTERMRDDEPAIRKAVRDALGTEPGISRWETVHGDLHWANLLQPRFALLDWELWGRGPAGTDAATLYCYSLLAPKTAARVWETFSDVLDSADGRAALRYAASRALHRVDMGDHPDLEEALHDLAERSAG